MALLSWKCWLAAPSPPHYPSPHRHHPLPTLLDATRLGNCHRRLLWRSGFNPYSSFDLVKPQRHSFCRSGRSGNYTLPSHRLLWWTLISALVLAFRYICIVVALITFKYKKYETTCVIDRWSRPFWQGGAVIESRSLPGDARSPRSKSEFPNWVISSNVAPCTTTWSMGRHTIAPSFPRPLPSLPLPQQQLQRRHR